VRRSSVSAVLLAANARLSGQGGADVGRMGVETAEAEGLTARSVLTTSFVYWQLLLYLTVWHATTCVCGGFSVPLSSTRLNMLGPRLNMLGPRLNMLGPRLNMLEPRLNMLGSRVNMLESRLNMLGPRANMLGPRVNMLGPRVNMLGPRASFLFCPVSRTRVVGVEDGEEEEDDRE
jgi:hypothetical protein